MPEQATIKNKSLAELLLERGHSVRSFAIQHGYKVATVYNAVNNERNGKKARKIRNHIKEFVYAK
jgi:hypothetical protein